MTDEEIDALSNEVDALWQKLDRAEAEVKILHHNWESLQRRLNAAERDRLLRAAVDVRLKDRLAAERRTP